MKDVKQVNEELNNALNEALLQLNEMAEIEGGIVVRNDDDDKKFAYFHWRGVHFELKQEIPKNITELKQRIYFKKEEKLLSSKDLQELLKLLRKTPQRDWARIFGTVYNYTVNTWQTLNGREI